LRLQKNTNDLEATYYLARVHSMAYSTHLVEVPIGTENAMPVFEHPVYDRYVPGFAERFTNEETRKAAFQDLTNAIALYQRALVLLKQSTNIDERRRMALSVPLGLAWCLEQAGRTNDAISMYRKTLEAAWRMEVTCDFDFKEWATNRWDNVKVRRNPPRADALGCMGLGICYSNEIIDYLLGLLDRAKDKQEIAQLNEDKKTVRTMMMRRPVTPIVIPLEANAEFSDLVNENASVAFDLDGSGIKRKWAWLTPKAGWLVFDFERTGCVESALQMFGNVTFWIFWPNGYEALSALDDNGDDVLSGDELRGLAIWNDRNCDGVSEPGEVTPVEELGIEVISCSSQVDANGMHWNSAGVIMTNGTMRASYDWIVAEHAD
jgi:hypothetical protein